MRRGGHDWRRCEASYVHIDVTARTDDEPARAGKFSNLELRGIEMDVQSFRDIAFVRYMLFMVGKLFLGPLIYFFYTNSECS